MSRTSSATRCGWCGCRLPEPFHDAWLVAADKAGIEKPGCIKCIKTYSAVIVRIEKETA
ncbi:MAG: hypothetical protein ABFE07_09160 [Armatimonadia bacterium]|jgi:hypothetical protein